jgi:hypothetical protein
MRSRLASRVVVSSLDLVKLTGERKVYAAILGLGLLGLVVDRAVLQPQHASAASADAPLGDPLVGKEGLSPKPKARPAASVEAPSLSARFRGAATKTLAGDERVIDAFNPNAGESRDDTVSSQPSDADLFKQSHKLTAIVTTENGGVAIVDGKTIGVGQKVGEFTLVKLDDAGAHFGRDGTPVLLKRPQRALKESSKETSR